MKMRTNDSILSLRLPILALCVSFSLFFIQQQRWTVQLLLVNAFVVVPKEYIRIGGGSSSSCCRTSSSSSQLYMDNNSKKKSSSTTTSSGSNKKTTTTSKSSKGSGFAGVTRDVQKQNKSNGGGGGIGGFPYAGSIRPGKLGPSRIMTTTSNNNNDVLMKIMKPDYWDTGTPIKNGRMMLPWMIEVKTIQEIEKMKQAGILARHILDIAGQAVQVGITTDEIDAIVHNEIIKNNAYPSPLNYHGFPKSCCTSVNEVICHGIPDDRKLQDGDIINLDITVYLNGYHGDCSEMFYVGNHPDDATKQLLQTTYDCWISACRFVKPGNYYKDIGAIIEDYITPHGYSTVKQFCGHGIGSVFHTNPNILHYRNNEPNGQMAVGHTFTIEPMICEGSAKTITWPDQWTATTIDGKRSAQFEHTLLVTDDGVEALTGKNINSPIQFWELESKVHKGIWLGTSKAAIEKMNEINQIKLAAQ